MKRKNPISLIVTLVFAAFFFFPAAHCYAQDEPTVITIADYGSLGGDTGHHAPALIPIQAAYFSSVSTIYVNFLYDLGTVSVEIENQTTESYSQTNINATQGAHPFVISGDDGVYEITFTLSDGHVYIGSFEIE